MTTMNEERAGEREAFKAWCESIGYPAALMTCGELEAFQAGAALQRAQGAVPEKKVESVRWGYRSLGYAEGWNACVDALLAAAPAHPAEQQETVCPDCLGTDRQPGVYGPHKCHCNASAERREQEGLHVWRATTRFGETCHFGEASTARAWAGENGTVERVELTPVPELRVVERQDQGEVQRLREALETLVEHFEYYMGDNECRPLENARAALAASTGQEVES